MVKKKKSPKLQIVVRWRWKKSSSQVCSLYMFLALILSIYCGEYICISVAFKFFLTYPQSIKKMMVLIIKKSTRGRLFTCLFATNAVFEITYEEQ